MYAEAGHSWFIGKGARTKPNPCAGYEGEEVMVLDVVQRLAALVQDWRQRGIITLRTMPELQELGRERVSALLSEASRSCSTPGSLRRR